MCPRRRKIENECLPRGLSIRVMRGQRRFRYRYLDGREKFFPIGTTATEAIEAVVLSNQVQRPVVTPQNLLKETDPYDRPLKSWLERVLERVKKEEFEAGKITQNVFRQFQLDTQKLQKSLGQIFSKQLTLDHVNQTLDQLVADGSANVYNRKLTLLRKCFDYIQDEGGMASNLADMKKRKAVDKKIRQRLSLENFKKIKAAAPPFLQIAMQLSLQTTHAVNEICAARYEHCEWYTEPKIENDVLIYGQLHIHRQKVKHTDASRVSIPIGPKIKKIIDDSKADNVASPYIVHEKLTKQATPSKHRNDPTQVLTQHLSKMFSNLRDSLKLYPEIVKAARPTFHEIRALSIHLYTKTGYDPQQRAAHSDAATTNIYKKGHEKWVSVAAGELEI